MGPADLAEYALLCLSQRQWDEVYLRQNLYKNFEVRTPLIDRWDREELDDV